MDYAKPAETGGFGFTDPALCTTHKPASAEKFAASRVLAQAPAK